jgi:aminotransferase
MKMSEYISPLVKNMPTSGIDKFFDLASEMKDVLSLSIGEPDFVTPLKITEAGIKSLREGHTYYSPNAGFPELRQGISDYLWGRFQMEYSPKDEMIVTVGASEGIDIAIRALITQGDEVIIPEPTFVAYKACVIFAGGTPVPIHLKETDQFKLRKEDLLNAITPKTKMLILSYPNNPTGAIMTKEDLEEIVEVLKDRDILVLSDEIYAELTYEKTHTSIASYPEMKEKTILVSGFSKAFAMTGWRMGYVCGHSEIISAMLKIHQYVIMSAPTIAQYASLEGLRNCLLEVSNMRDEYNKRRKALLEGVKKSGLTCFEPEGAFYAFLNISSTGLTSEEFCERLLQEEKVAVIPGSAFGDSGQGFVRVCYAYSLESIEEAMIKMGNFLEKIREINDTKKRVKGIEPSLPAWEADVLPLNYTRDNKS